MPETSAGRGTAAAIARQLCPRCREGRVFRALMAMNAICPVCGHRFEREPGYFLGAMYVSYGIAVALYLGLVVLLRLVIPSLSEGSALPAGLLLFLPFVPPIFRYARVIWMYLDWSLDPGP